MAAIFCGTRDSCFIELIGYFFKLILRELVNVRAIDPAGRDAGPSDFLGGFNLSGEIFGRFVGKSGEIHGLE